MNFLDHPYFSMWATLFTSCSALLSSTFMDRDFLFEFVDEGGFIETLTLVFYVIAALFALCYPNPRVSLKTKISVAFIMMIMLAREADLHKFLGMSMLKLKFWITNHSSVQDKFIAAFILLFVILAVGHLLVTSFKTWRNDLRKREKYAVTIFIFFAVLVISKILDRSVNAIYEVSGWMAPKWVVAIQQPQEEFLECLLPILIIISIIQYSLKMKRESKMSH